MWLVVPLPAWPILTVPGLALASASAARMFAKRPPGLPTMIMGTVLSREIGVNRGTIDGLPAR